MEQRRVTIKDIAVAVGVTAQTVSRALRDMPDISEDMKKLINDTAQQMGYIKNLYASALRRGSTHSIAVIYDTLANPYFSVMTGYLNDAFKHLGYSLVIFSSDSHKIGAETIDMILSRNVDGVVSFLELEPQTEELIKRYNLPLIVLGRHGSESIDNILTDDVSGGSQAARKLIDVGCKNIVHITESFYVTCALARYDGFRSELEKENMYDEKLLILLEGEPLENKFVNFLKSGKKFDGIFAFNDILALEALYLLEREGIKNIKVIGYDNIQEDLKIPRRLTTIGSDKRQMAEVAAHVLIEKIERPSDKVFKKIHNVFLVEGETT